MQKSFLIGLSTWHAFVRAKLSPLRAPSDARCVGGSGHASISHHACPPSQVRRRHPCVSSGERAPGATPAPFSWPAASLRPAPRPLRRARRARADHGRLERRALAARCLGSLAGRCVSALGGVRLLLVAFRPWRRPASPRRLPP